MLSATFMQEEQELEVTLPRVSAAAPLSEAPREIVVNVLENGAVVVDGQPTSLDALLQKMKAALAEYPDQSVAVRGHGKTNYENVVRVHSLLRKAGVKKVVARVMETR
jgi:biopolymer transport protein ExbD